MKKIQNTIRVGIVLALFAFATVASAQQTTQIPLVSVPDSGFVMLQVGGSSQMCTVQKNPDGSFSLVPAVAANTAVAATPVHTIQAPTAAKHSAPQVSYPAQPQPQQVVYQAAPVTKESDPLISKNDVKGFVSGTAGDATMLMVSGAQTKGGKAIGGAAAGQGVKIVGDKVLNGIFGK